MVDIPPHFSILQKIRAVTYRKQVREKASYRREAKICLLLWQKYLCEPESSFSTCLVLLTPPPVTYDIS